MQNEYLSVISYNKSAFSYPAGNKVLLISKFLYVDFYEANLFYIPNYSIHNCFYESQHYANEIHLYVKLLIYFHFVTASDHYFTGIFRLHNGCLLFYHMKVTFVYAN